MMDGDTKAFLRKLGRYTAGTLCVSLLASVFMLGVLWQFPLLPSRDCVVSYSMDGKTFDDAEVYLVLLPAREDPLYFVRLPNGGAYEWLTFSPQWWRQRIGTPSELPIFKWFRYTVSTPIAFEDTLADRKIGNSWKFYETPESLVAENASMRVEIYSRCVTVPRIFGIMVAGFFFIPMGCILIGHLRLINLHRKNPKDFSVALRRVLGIKDVPSSRKKILKQMVICLLCLAPLAVAVLFWPDSLFTYVLIGIAMTVNVLLIFCLPALAIIWGRNLLELQLPSETPPPLPCLKTFLGWSSLGFAAGWMAITTVMFIQIMGIWLPEYFLQK